VGCGGGGGGGGGEGGGHRGWDMKETTAHTGAGGIPVLRVRDGTAATAT